MSAWFDLDGADGLTTGDDDVLGAVTQLRLVLDRHREVPQPFEGDRDVALVAGVVRLPAGQGLTKGQGPLEQLQGPCPVPPLSTPDAPLNVHPAEEAVAAYTELIPQLTATLGATHPDTLTARNNRALFLGRGGDYAGAVAAYTELIPQLTATLGATHPDTLTARNNRALFLGWIADILTRQGDIEEALIAIEEAVEHYRELAGARPDAFLPDLAASLNTQSLRLAALGRREAALTAIQEAVDIRRELADRHPFFLESLAASLTSLGIRRTELGDFDGALSADREAVSVYANLSALEPGRYRGAWEQAVSNLIVDLRDLGRSESEIAAEVGRLAPPGG